MKRPTHPVPLELGSQYGLEIAFGYEKRVRTWTRVRKKMPRENGPNGKKGLKRAQYGPESEKKTQPGPEQGSKRGPDFEQGPEASQLSKKGHQYGQGSEKRVSRVLRGPRGTHGSEKGLKREH